MRDRLAIRSAIRAPHWPGLVILGWCFVPPQYNDSCTQKLVHMHLKVIHPSSVPILPCIIIFLHHSELNAFIHWNFAYKSIEICSAIYTAEGYNIVMWFSALLRLPFILLTSLRPTANIPWGLVQATAETGVYESPLLVSEPL